MVTRRRVRFDAVHRFEVSPDGHTIALSAFLKDAKESVLEARTSAGSIELARRTQPEIVVVQGWSPDGQFVLFTTLNTTKEPPHDLWRVPVWGGPANVSARSTADTDQSDCRESNGHGDRVHDGHTAAGTVDDGERPAAIAVTGRVSIRFRQRCRVQPTPWIVAIEKSISLKIVHVEC